MKKDEIIEIIEPFYVVEVPEIKRKRLKIVGIDPKGYFCYMNSGSLLKVSQSDEHHYFIETEVMRKYKPMLDQYKRGGFPLQNELVSLVQYRTKLNKKPEIGKKFRAFNDSIEEIGIIKETENRITYISSGIERTESNFYWFATKDEAKEYLIAECDKRIAEYSGRIKYQVEKRTEIEGL
jgi:hypothetical protein